ncbi:MAG: sigma-70 family RNA polymerase sigma factor [Kiritimatiellae bacterium]|nr:sigma-70 family RNA polymerase sigma factor [Kiritimatiellia bacterium]
MSFIREVRKDIELEAIRLMREYHANLIVEAKRLCGDDSVAEDLAMKTIEVYMSKPEEELPPAEKSLAYLKSILRNIYHDSVRGKAQACMVYLDPEDIERLDELGPADNSTEEAILAHSDAELVRNAIARLPESARSAIVMHYFESLSIPQIAELLKKSPDSVKSNLYYARKVLAKRLGKAFGRTALAIAALLFGGSLLYAAALAIVGVFSPSAPDETAEEPVAAETAAEEPPVAAKAPTAVEQQAIVAAVADAAATPAVETNAALPNAGLEISNIENKEQPMNTKTCTSILAAATLAASSALAEGAIDCDCELVDISTNTAKVVWKATATSPTQVTVRFVSGFESDFFDGVVVPLGTFTSDTVITSAVTFARASTTYWRLEGEDEGGNAFASPIETISFSSGEGSSAYVASGLVAQWDGIDNAGRGVHSAAPTVWKDLVGSGDVTIPYWVEVRDNSLVSVGDTVTRTAPTLSSIAGITGDDVTIEVVARRVRWTKTDNYLNLQSVISSPWGNFGYRLQYDNRFFSLLPPNGSNVTQTRLYNMIDSSNLATMRQTMAARITRNSTDAVNDFVISGAKTTLNYDNTYTGTLPSIWTFFNNTRTEVEFFAIRVYNRRLTDEELAANAAIDQRRFVDFGEGPLQVKYDGPGASCRREYNCWPIPGARFSCHVPRPVADGSGASVCVGWTLFAETGSDVWTEEAHGTNSEMSYLDDGRRRRLVWHTASSRNLPGGYVRLENLDAHGEQMIDTGYSPNYMTHATLDLQFDGTFVPNVNSAFFGAPDSGTPNHLIFTANFSGGAAPSSGWSLYFWTQKGYNYGGAIKNLVVSQAIVKNRNILDIDMETGVAKYGAHSIAISTRTAAQTQPETVKIFGREVPFNSYPTMRLFGATFADGSTLRRELVPARSAETGLRGLYDYVTGNFYTNIVENGADFDGTAGGGLYVDGEPERLGEPTIPYGCNSLESGVAFELAATNTVNEGKSYFVKSIARYSFNETTGQWTLVDRTNGRKTAAAYSGEPVKYVLEWERSPGFVFIVH